MRIAPFAGDLGVVVADIDLRDCDHSVRGALRQQLLERHVVIVRGQSLDADEQVQATKMFGPVYDERSNGEFHSYVSNVRKGAVPTGDAEMPFHTDATFIANPYLALALYAVDVAPDAAPTAFVSAADVCAALPPALRARIGGLRAWHAFGANGVRPSDYVPGAEHPVVVTHPNSGIPLLYVHPVHTMRIVGMHEESSAELLAELYASFDEAANVGVHRWMPGDYVVWDNFALQHRRAKIGGSETRDLRRTVVTDDVSAAQHQAVMRWRRKGEADRTGD